MMRRTLISLAIALLLPVSASHANVANDLGDSLSSVEVLSNALSHCISVETSSSCTVAEIDQLMLDVAAVDVELLDSFVSAGIENGLDAKTVVEAAIKAGANPAEVEQAAILAGADPTEVAEATAAGGTPPGQGQGLNIAPGQTGNAVTPAPFGNNAGGGGGGNTSPT